MFESILTSNNYTFIVDNGASTFLPLLQYFSDNCVMEMFNNINTDVYIHTIIVGGQAQADTIEGFESISELIKGTKVKIIIWFNEFQGVPAIENIPIIDTKFLNNNRDLLAGAVIIKDRKSDAYDDDIKKMTSMSLTLEEIKSSEQFMLMSKSRLHRVFNDIYQQLDIIYNDNNEA